MARSSTARRSREPANVERQTLPRRPRQALSSAAPIGLLALHLLHALKKPNPHGLAFVAGNEARAERLGAVLHAMDPGCNVMVLPRFDTLPFDDLAPSREISGRRASVLRRLAERANQRFLISTVDAMLPRVPRLQAWDQACLSLTVGQPLDIGRMRESLIALGYEPDEQPDYPGGVLFHGQTVELFPAGALRPVRIEHQDGIIRGMHAFDLMRQTDTDSLDTLVIDAMSEKEVAGDTEPAATAMADIFAYLGEARIIADADVPAQIEARLAGIDESGIETRSREAAFTDRTTWHRAMQRATVLPKISDVEAIPNFSVQRSARSSLRRFLAENRHHNARILFTAAVEEDLLRMERVAGLRTRRATSWTTASRTHAGEVASLLVDFDAGFGTGTAHPLVVITASEVLGSRARHLQPMARSRPAADAATSLTLGSAVVHLQRGLALLQGLERVSAPDLAEHEMVRLGFADDEAALVPVADLALIWPYAHDASGIKLDDAGGHSWVARCLEAEREIDRTAHEMSELVRTRLDTPAPRLVPPTPEYERFVARFPYVPTPDQTAAIEDVLNDLASGHPMDRVICGDVGFGKTEVALRAAAAAVFAGKQVALIAPTTVLARQHLLTFHKRFAPFGTAVGHLSRLSAAADARKVKQQLRDGSLRLVIGTHALAAADVAFADLGLVIIDEEQHFGAAEKAALSQRRSGLHTLAMSATPIPRTMAGALAGLRDFSVIATPPVQRAPIVTKVSPLLDSTLAMALRREHRRRGQSFVICPRIKDLEPVHERLRRSTPELSVVMIHGRMPARDIDDRLMRFVAGEADVLLATNIVENGLDIPRANTILICAPERFGLAQLHQLRGRVGRGSTRAFAYLLTEHPSEQAEKRLSALLQLSKPGAGFQISARDLDLRGAGDLLSEQQAGHVQVFGPALYHHLLARAREGRPRSAADMWAPELNVDTPALLPASYVKDEATRLDVYARLAKAETLSDVDEVEDEMHQRFGPLPPEASNLIVMAKLRLDCLAVGIQRIDVGPTGIAANLRPEAVASPTSGPISRRGQRLLYKRKLGKGERLAAMVRFVNALKAPPEPTLAARRRRANPDLHG